MKVEPLLFPSHLLGVWVPSLPCGSKEADGKEEELETGREAFLLDSVQLGLGLALGSDMDKLGHGVRDHPPTSH